MNDKKCSAEDEQSFMNDLLAGIDSSFFDAVPSPDPSPKKPQRSSRVPTQATRDTQKLNSKSSENVRKVDGVDETELAALLQGAEDWDWNDMEDDFRTPASMKQSNYEITTTERRASDCRCIVESISSEDGEKVLQTKNEDDKERRTVILLDDWVETDIHPGDTINLLDCIDSDTRKITISAKQGLLILHPDILVTATSVANASHCARRPLLSLLLKPLSDISPSLLWGNILHEAVQRCFTESQWDLEFINTVLDDLVEDRMHDLVRLGINAEEAKAELGKRATNIQIFGMRYVAPEPKDSAVISSGRTKPGQETLLGISRPLATEEDIWSPKYGLKGKIDVTVEACIEERAVQKGSHRQAVLGFGRTKTRLPFEIKTGRSIAGIEHRAQTALYSLLLQDRYHDAPGNSPDNSIAQGGLLYYTQSNDVSYVSAGRNEVRGLIMTRNELAGYLVNRSGRRKGQSTASDGHEATELSILPETINQERTCGRCYVSDACMLYRKAIEAVEDDSSPIADLYQLKTGHLSPSQLSFFKNWENLITLEEQDIVRFRKELWTLGAKEREEKGKCLADMILDPAFTSPPRKAGKEARIHQFTYGFTRRDAAPFTSVVSSMNSQPNSSLLTGHIMVGDAVTVSVVDNPHLVALARGFVLDLTAERIVIGVDCSLSNGSIRAKSTKYSGIDEIVFRIDKDEMTGGMARIRDNLAQLFYVSGQKRRLELIVDLKAPNFSERTSFVTSPREYLNEGQRHAIRHVLSANDYALILGMPGTGKTTTVAELIRVLVEMGKTVLLTSYTHSAVDTILLKLKDNSDFDILRLGNEDKLHSGVLGFTVNADGKPASVEQLEARLLSPPVVATTALSIDHALFSRRRFDYCIVDEASQITLPTCLGPLRFADKFILVGDHFQLPPLVRNRDARKGGLDVSLFRRLSDAHPEAVVDLALQYRMNADIMLLSNRLIYSGRLKCGSQEVAASSLSIPNRKQMQAACTACGPICWREELLQSSRKAVFVNTDELPALDSRVGDLIQNDTEALLVQHFTETLLKGGVKEEQIGIISLYRQQIKVLTRLLHPHKDIEILTADRSQGRDKDCIIISLVRANSNNDLGDLLKDWRRINVAFTRARSKLVIFGSKKTLKTSPLLEEFFNLMEERNWVLTLPPGADTCHNRESLSQSPLPAQTTPKLSTKKRTLQDMGFARHSQKEKENELAGQLPSEKKKAKKARLGDGLIRSRPILRDLVNNAK